MRGRVNSLLAVPCDSTYCHCVLFALSVYSSIFREVIENLAGRPPTLLFHLKTSHLGYPKVAEHKPSISQQKYVLRLQIPVQDQSAMHVVQAQRYLNEPVEDFTLGKEAPPAKEQEVETAVRHC